MGVPFHFPWTWPHPNTSIERVCETLPLSCPNGHILGAGQVLVGWRACGCAGARHGGHRTWTCRRCLEAGVGNETSTIYATRHHEPDPELRFGIDLSHLTTTATALSSERARPAAALAAAEGGAMPGLTTEQRAALSTALDRLAPTGADPIGPATVAAVSLLLRELATDADAQDPVRQHGEALAARIWNKVDQATIDALKHELERVGLDRL